MQRLQLLTYLVGRFTVGCRERNLDITEDFARYVVHLTARDSRIGIARRGPNITICQMETFLDNLWQAYADPLNNTICNLKLTYTFKRSQEIDFKYVKKKYETKFRKKLQLLIDDILQYPETSCKTQLDQLFAKMQVFIVASYDLGCPKDHVLLKQTAQSLNSVIARSDLQNYVLKKKYHRLEYLQRLTSTVGGILIYNNDGPNGDREHVRDIFAELEMAQRNTQETLQASIKRAEMLRTHGQNGIARCLQVNMEDYTILTLVPIEKLQIINRFVNTFKIYELYELQLHEKFEKTKYLISMDKKRYECVIDKINDTLKMRSAIESELIFPHFVYLSEVWLSLCMYFNHLVELNKVQDKLNALVTDEMESEFLKIVDEIIMHAKNPQLHTFAERIDNVNRIKGDMNFLKLKPNFGDFCALTMILTNGLLLPAKITRKLCQNLELQFGFHDSSYAKFGELYINDFMEAFKNTLFTNTNLVLLFDIENEMLAQDLLFEAPRPPKNKEIETQTEMVIENDLTVPNWINATWNVWDYHRETIHMANIRKCQTQDTQSKLSFGKRNAQNQTYNTRSKMQ